MKFVDTNLFLRLLLKDQERLHLQAKKIFFDSGSKRNFSDDRLNCFFEIYWVLKSFYQKRKKRVIEVLTKILDLEFILLPERELLREAVDFYARFNLELEDCYHLVYLLVNQGEGLITFDYQLKRVWTRLKKNE